MGTYALYGIVVEAAAPLGQTPYTVRWVSHPYPQDPDSWRTESISGITRESAERLTEALRKEGIDAEPYVGPIVMEWY